MEAENVPVLPGFIKRHPRSAQQSLRAFCTARYPDEGRGLGPALSPAKNLNRRRKPYAFYLFG
jgi:hypothetical protein